MRPSREALTDASDLMKRLHPAALEQGMQRTFVERSRATIGRVDLPSGLARELPRRPQSTFAEQLTLHEVIGSGGMGVVHHATQNSLSRAVAVKTLQPRNQDERFAELMLREAWLTGGLEHPNIVPIHEIVTTDSGAPAIVMKRIEGTTWFDLMSKHEMITERFGDSDPIEWNISVLLKVFHAIEFAHSRAIIHRDLKPANVMIGSYGEVYVVDWGLALSLKVDPNGRLPFAPAHTDLAGTPAYMAPEMIDKGFGRLTRQTDIYQLGAVLFEIFTGSPPHLGDTFVAIAGSIMKSAPHFPESVPAEVQAICKRAMHREPGLRYDTAREFRIDIESYLHHRESRRLEARAYASYASLLRALGGEKSDARALAIFHTLGECRFGFRAALVAWPGNESARLGLDRALLAAVDHELAEGHGGTAAALLSEVANPPDETVTRVRSTARTLSEVGTRLRRLENEIDPGVGRKERNVRILPLIAGGVIGPALAWGYLATGHTLNAAVLLLVGVANFACGAGLLWLRTDRRTLNEVNRKARLSAVAALGAMVLVSMVAAAAGLSFNACLVTWMIVQAVAWLFASIWVDRTVLVAAIVSGVAAAAGTLWPATLLPAVAMANFSLAIVASRLAGSAQERIRKVDLEHAEWLATRADPPTESGAKSG